MPSGWSGPGHRCLPSTSILRRQRRSAQAMPRPRPTSSPRSRVWWTSRSSFARNATATCGFSYSKRSGSTARKCCVAWVRKNACGDAIAIGASDWSRKCDAIGSVPTKPHCLLRCGSTTPISEPHSNSVSGNRARSTRACASLTRCGTTGESADSSARGATGATASWSETPRRAQADCASFLPRATSRCSKVISPPPWSCSAKGGA